MCIFYKVFEEDEMAKAFEVLLGFINDFDCHIDLGVLGGRVIFHVLSDFGYTDLAIKMMTREDFPSYGNWIKRGATTLWEDFLPEGEGASSMNHHFWGDISAWFIKVLLGINFNPTKHNINEVEIKPHFADSLDYAKGYHIANGGKISVFWKKEGEGVTLTLDIPTGICAFLSLPEGYVLKANGNSTCEITSGTYEIIKK
jgi:alpha-L-rhamnosidase